MLVGSLLEIVALAGVLPFVSLVIQPEVAQTNKYLAWAYQAAAQESLPRFVSLIGVVVIMLMTCSVLANWGILFMQNRYIASCQTRLAKDLLDRCMHAPYSWFLSRNSTILSRLFDDVAMWSRGVVQRLLMMVNNIGVMVLALTMALAFSPGMGLGIILVVAMLGGASVLLMRPQLTRLAARKRAAVDTMSLASHQALAGIKDIKLSSREDHFLHLFDRAYSRMTRDHAKLNVWHESPSIFLQGLAQVTLVSIALILWNMGVEKGQLATQLALVIIVTTKVIPTVSSFSTAVNSLFQALPHVHVINEVLESIERETYVAASTKGTVKAITDWSVIHIERVGYQYPNSSEWALKDVTFSLSRGGAYGIVGSSAAGKSTLVDLLVGLFAPTSGRICIDEEPLSVLVTKDWQRRIAYVPQMPFIADDSLRANVAFGVQQSEVDDRWVRDCLLRANLANLPEDLDQGLDTKLGERGLRLSGGQRQRIAIARALFNRPEILVLDEATSALDSLSESEILAALKNLRGQVTTITIAHRISTVAACDEIFVLEAGRLVGRGSDAELRANHELFKRMAAAGV